MFFHLFNWQKCVRITSKKHIVFIVSFFGGGGDFFFQWRRKQDANLTYAYVQS